MNSFIHKLGIGTVQFGQSYGISNNDGITPENEALKILDYARTAGIELLDTAYAYGESESVLGKLGVDDFKIITKYQEAKDETAFENAFYASLNRLGINKAYGLLAHTPDLILNNPEIVEFMRHLKQRGLVDKIGISCNFPEEIDKLIDLGFIPEIVQVPYNYLDSRFEKTLISLKESGCETHTRSTFLQGLFFMDPKRLNGFFDEVKPILQKLSDHAPNLPSRLLMFCLKKTFIDKVIIGINNLAQLEQNISFPNPAKELPPPPKINNYQILSPVKWPRR